MCKGLKMEALLSIGIDYILHNFFQVLYINFIILPQWRQCFRKFFFWTQLFNHYLIQLIIFRIHIHRFIFFEDQIDKEQKILVRVLAYVLEFDLKFLQQNRRKNFDQAPSENESYLKLSCEIVGSWLLKLRFFQDFLIIHNFRHFFDTIDIASIREKNFLFLKKLPEKRIAFDRFIRLERYSIKLVWHQHTIIMLIFVRLDRIGTVLFYFLCWLYGLNLCEMLWLWHFFIEHYIGSHWFLLIFILLYYFFR